MLFSNPFNENSSREYRIASVTLFEELNALEIGYNQTSKGLYQVLKRDVYILHYITKGRGEYCGNRFGENDMYIVAPGEVETVVSDSDEPYEAYWIMLNGTAAKELLKKCGMPNHNAVVGFDGVKECAQILKEALFSVEYANEYEEAALMNSALHKILSVHFRACDLKRLTDNISQRVMKFINENYYSNISVGSIAKSFNFSRNYLYTLFKRDYGISLQEYLLNLRIQKAKELLANERHLAINEVALAVGYSDALYFSRIFRKKTGIAPTQFIKENRENKLA